MVEQIERNQQGKSEFLSVRTEKSKRVEVIKVEGFQIKGLMLQDGLEKVKYPEMPKRIRSKKKRQQEIILMENGEFIIPTYAYKRRVNKIEKNLMKIKGIEEKTTEEIVVLKEIDEKQYQKRGQNVRDAVKVQPQGPEELKPGEGEEKQEPGAHERAGRISGLISELNKKTQELYKVVDDGIEKLKKIEEHIEPEERLEEKFIKTEKDVDKAGKSIDEEIEKFGEEHPMLKERIKQVFRDHPVATTAILCGLVGTAYAGGVNALDVTGPAAAPLYFAAKGVLAKVGVGFFVPYTGGASSITMSAALGKGIHILGEKIGVIKSVKDEKSEVKEEKRGKSGLRSRISGIIKGIRK